MYCIAVLAVNEKEGQDYAKYIIDYCTERSIFPLVELYQNQEMLFEQIHENCAGCSASCTAWSVRTECSRTSPLLISGMWCHLVQ